MVCDKLKHFSFGAESRTVVWSCQASQGRAIFGVSALQIGSRYALESEIKLQLVTLPSWGFILGGTKGTCVWRDSLIDTENVTGIYIMQ